VKFKKQYSKEIIDSDGVIVHVNFEMPKGNQTNISFVWLAKEQHA